MTISAELYERIRESAEDSGVNRQARRAFRSYLKAMTPLGNGSYLFVAPKAPWTRRAWLAVRRYPLRGTTG
jgi:hypothetical protein